MTSSRRRNVDGGKKKSSCSVKTSSESFRTSSVNENANGEEQNAVGLNLTLIPIMWSLKKRKSKNLSNEKVQ